MYCLAEGNPLPTAGDYWWTDSQGNNHNIQNLTIRGASKNHTGEYTCTVNVNSRGGYGTLTGSTITRITVQCKYVGIIQENIHLLLMLPVKEGTGD